MRIERCLDADLPEGVTVQKRTDGRRTFVFLHNLKPIEQVVDVGAARLRDVADGRERTGAIRLAGHVSLAMEKL